MQIILEKVVVSSYGCAVHLGQAAQSFPHVAMIFYNLKPCISQMLIKLFCVQIADSTPNTAADPSGPAVAAF